MAPRKAKQAIPKAKAAVFVPAPKDAAHVRQAFEEHAKRPKDGVVVTPEELRRWAETGVWPDSSG